MKYLKMLGLAAIAAMALMAFVGAGTASATTLTNGTETLGVGAALQSSLKSGTSAELKTVGGALIATCTGSEVKGTISVATGTWVEGPVKKENLTWSGCSQETVTTGDGVLKIMRTGENQGEVWSTGSKVTLSVFGTSCTYGTGEGTKLGTIKGGTEAELAINATIPRVEGNTILCPATGIWTANYLVTTPHVLGIIE